MKEGFKASEDGHTHSIQPKRSVYSSPGLQGKPQTEHHATQDHIHADTSATQDGASCPQTIDGSLPPTARESRWVRWHSPETLVPG